ncbi:PadR family transcriptional regulator [Streptomyces sviceus]|uniref:PadR family transcriptional regulator n=1 Tax=Streptomyces sviceus TaxID=285530 RepID=UPI0036E80F5A
MTKTTLEVLDVLYQGAEKLYGLKIAQGTGLMTGTVYPILARLEKAGWVTSVWEEGEGPDVRGARRRFYQLTPMGREHARAALAERAVREAQAAHRRPQTGLA